MSHLRLPTLDLPAGLLGRLRRLTEATGAPGVMYARISEDREGAGLGVERQLDDQCSLFTQLGLRLAGVYADNDLSAFTGKPRPDYLAMLADLDTGRARVVTAWHTDRLHRTPRELETYIDLAERRGVVTHSVKAGPLDLATPSGRAVARTLCAWARFESEHKGERVRAARRQAAEQGRWQGGCRPFGFEADGTTIRPTEAAALAQASEAIVSGASLRSVVRDLNEAGHRTAWDREWTSQAVRDMLRRPRNAGLTSYGAETFPAAWPAIVPETTWRAAVSILSNPERRTNTTGSSRVKWLGSGLYVCGICGEPALRVSNQDPGSEHPAYRCKARDNTRQSGHVTRAAQATWTTTSSGSSWPACNAPTPPNCSPHRPIPTWTPRHCTPRPPPSVNASPTCLPPSPTARSPLLNSAPAPTNSARALATLKTLSLPLPLPTH